MPLGLGSALWGVILPKETTNLISNPSLEFGSTGWSALAGGATIGTTSYKQAFGAWSLQVNHKTTSEGAFYNAGTPAAGSYTASAFVNGTSGHRYRLVAESAGGAALGAGSITAAGGWQSIVTPFGLASGTGLNIVARHIDNADGTFYLDGVQLESGTFQTTYIDGDQPGGTWTGAQHASTSTRTSQYRGGGSLIALADLGLQVDQMPGAGMPPIENSSQSYAVVDGAQFQRQRGASRHFTLTAKPINGTSLSDFHVVRRTLIDAFKPDLVTPQQPIRFLYVGGAGTIQCDAYYEKGLELGNMDGPVAENAAISFAGYDPYWYFTYQQGTTLAPLVALGSVNFIARRNPQGQWGTMGANGSTIFNPASGPITVWTMLQNGGGSVIFGGNWGTLAGTVAPGIGVYYPTTNTFGTLAGGTVNSQVISLALNPAGTLFLGGDFTTLAGTAAKSVGRHFNNAFGTLQGGSLTGPTVWSLLYSPNGTLFIGGEFTNIQGTPNSRNLAMWTGAFGSMNGTVGLTNNTGNIFGLAWGLDTRLFLTGAFTNARGTVGTAIAFWKDGNYGTMGGIGDGVAAWGYGLSVAPNGVLYEGGDFVYTTGGSALRAAAWNGVQHQALGYGLGGGVRAVLADPQTGNIYFGGAFTIAGSINSSANYAVWNGAAFIPPDILTVNAVSYTVGTVRSMLLAQDRSLYIGGDFFGTTSAAAVGTIINTGRAAVYPVLRLRNLGAGTARVFQLVNTTINAGIYMNYVMQGGEQALLNLQPGSRSFQSSAQGNVFGLILPGSNLATFSLLPGTNYISYFADSGSVEASFFWTPRSWSIDGGTIQ